MFKSTFLFFISTFVLFLISNNVFAQKYYLDNNHHINFYNELHNYQNTKYYSTKNISHHYSALNLLGQNLAGYAVGVGLALPSYYLSKTNNLAGSDDKTNFIIFSLISYIVGSATGVYCVANMENPKISYWETLGYSTVAGAIGIAILTSTFDGDSISPIGVIITLAFPTISAMIYTSYVADWPIKKNEVGFQYKTWTHKDLIEYSKIFNMELFRMNF